jgi:hypothetical protein
MDTSMIGKLMECHSFSGMKDEEMTDHNGAAYIEFVDGNKLRHRGYTMINGFPCQINHLSSVKPGKHGSAKITAIGQGVFDGKRRETIFHGKAPKPFVQKHQDIPCEVKSATEVTMLEDVHSLIPRLLSIPAASVKVEGEATEPYALVTLVVTCGHYKVTDVKYINDIKLSRGNADEEVDASASCVVVSKKNARKQEKLLKKQQKTTAAPN